MRSYKIIVIFLLSFFKLYSQELILDLTYEKHKLPFEYPYQKGTRVFQSDKISDKLMLIDSFSRKVESYGEELGILINYKNRQGNPPKTENNKIDKYQIERDSYGTRRYQGIPLYSEPPSSGRNETDNSVPKATIKPKKYAYDGELVSFFILDNGWAEVLFPKTRETWYVPPNYIKKLNNKFFNHAVVVDVTNQNIMTLEKKDNNWLVRSMTHSTTGLKKPPYSFQTELGIFVMQDKLLKMNYLKEGSRTEIEGFAPFASRFSGGAYVHGIPINLPSTTIIEATPSLGTTPRSHKCVRTRSSHAEFIYNWAPILETVVIVID